MLITVFVVGMQKWSITDELWKWKIVEMIVKKYKTINLRQPIIQFVMCLVLFVLNKIIKTDFNYFWKNKPSIYTQSKRQQKIPFAG